MNVIRVRATLRAHGEVHDLALHARAQPARRSLARERPGEVRVDRRRRRRGTRAIVEALPGRARRRAGGARRCAASWRTHLRARSPRCRRQRDAFLLQQEGGLSLAEIAELTGVGVETVKSRLRYAVAKLRSTASDPLRTRGRDCQVRDDARSTIPTRPALDAAWRAHSRETPPARWMPRSSRPRIARWRSAPRKTIPRGDAPAALVDAAGRGRGDRRRRAGHPAARAATRIGHRQLARVSDMPALARSTPAAASPDAATRHAGRRRRRPRDASRRGDRAPAMLPHQPSSDELAGARTAAAKQRATPSAADSLAPPRIAQPRPPHRPAENESTNRANPPTREIARARHRCRRPVARTPNLPARTSVAHGTVATCASRSGGHRAWARLRPIPRFPPARSTPTRRSCASENCTTRASSPTRPRSCRHCAGPFRMPTAACRRNFARGRQRSSHERSRRRR